MIDNTKLHDEWNMFLENTFIYGMKQGVLPKNIIVIKEQWIDANTFEVVIRCLITGDTFSKKMENFDNQYTDFLKSVALEFNGKRNILSAINSKRVNETEFTSMEPSVY